MPVAVDTKLFETTQHPGQRGELPVRRRGAAGRRGQAGVDITTAADVPTSAALLRSPTLQEVVADEITMGRRAPGSWRAAAPGIENIRDLAGKSISTPLGTSAAYFIANALSHNNVEAQLVQVSPSAMVTAAQRSTMSMPCRSSSPTKPKTVQALGPDAIELTGGTYTTSTVCFWPPRIQSPARPPRRHSSPPSRICRHGTVAPRRFGG